MKPNPEPALCHNCGCEVPAQTGFHIGGTAEITTPTGRRRTFGATWCARCTERTNPTRILIRTALVML